MLRALHISPVIRYQRMFLEQYDDTKVSGNVDDTLTLLLAGNPRPHHPSQLAASDQN